MSFGVSFSVGSARVLGSLAGGGRTGLGAALWPHPAATAAARTPINAKTRRFISQE